MFLEHLLCARPCQGCRDLGSTQQQYVTPLLVQPFLVLSKLFGRSCPVCSWNCVCKTLGLAHLPHSESMSLLFPRAGNSEVTKPTEQRTGKQRREFPAETHTQ